MNMLQGNRTVQLLTLAAQLSAMEVAADTKVSTDLAPASPPAAVATSAFKRIAEESGRSYSLGNKEADVNQAIENFVKAKNSADGAISAKILLHLYDSQVASGQAVSAPLERIKPAAEGYLHRITTSEVGYVSSSHHESPSVPAVHKGLLERMGHAIKEKTSNSITNSDWPYAIGGALFVVSFIFTDDIRRVIARIRRQPDPDREPPKPHPDGTQTTTKNELGAGPGALETQDNRGGAIGMGGWFHKLFGR